MSFYTEENPLICIFKIKDFSSLTVNFNTPTKRIIYRSSKIDLGLKLRLYIITENASCSFHIKVDNSSGRMNYKFEIFSKICNSSIYSSIYSDDFDTTALSTHWKNVIKFEDLLSPESFYLQEDCLTVKVFIWAVLLQQINLKTVNYCSSLSENEKSSLKCHIKNLKYNHIYENSCSFSNGSTINVQLVCTEENELQVTLFPSEKGFVLKIYIYVNVLVPNKKMLELKYQKRVEDDFFALPALSIDCLNSKDFWINCCLVYSKRRKSQTKFEFIMEDDPDTSYMQNFSWMLEQQRVTNVQLKVDGRNLPVHRFVLCLRSPVFMAMFANDTIEKEKGEIVIEDFNYNIMEEFVRYLYGKPLADITYNKAMQLIQPSDKYEFLPLKRHCSEVLQHSLTDETFFDIIVISDLVYDHKLSAACLDFFKENFKSLLVSPLWRNFSKSYPELAADTLCLYAKDY